MASRFHVLIVEDEPLIIEVLQGTLESEYRVSSAGTVGQALALLRTAHVDAVLLDSVLPDGPGVEVACAAEALGAVVIEMSGYPAVIGDLQRSARRFLRKPFGAESLFSTIADALHDSGRSRAARLPLD
jgi:DNA-binding NtrC family response regulator